MNKNNIDSIVNKVLNEEFSKRSNLLFEKKVKKDIDEKLVGKQHKIDKNKNGKIDAEDFKLLKKDKKSVKMTEEELVSFIENIVNESNEISLENNIVTMTEDELVSFIKDIVNEAEGDKLTKKPKSLTDVESLLKKSKSENEKNLKDVGKKMTEYIKYGSNGKYIENPDTFPKTNGELKKSDVKAYRMDSAEEEYIDNLGRGPGMENLSYDEVSPNDEWLTDNIEGSSKTGNNPKWANTGKSDINNNVNKKRKNNYFAGEKKRAYQKSQDVHIVQDGDERPDFIKKLKESTKRNPVLIEEFNKMKNLIKYNKITQ